MRLKFTRRIVLLAAIIGAVICIILLLNFTASNPTGRRYSSEIPVTTGATIGENQAAGFDAERILARDLGTSTNNIGAAQCGCNATLYADSVPRTCDTCVVYNDDISTFVRPDFVTGSYIAEAKHSANLNTADIRLQITVYAQMANELDIPLWLYTRVEDDNITTLIPDEMQSLVDSTGGGVVRYFTVPGYVDPVDRDAGRGLVVASVVITIIGVWEWVAWRKRTSSDQRVPINVPTGPDAGSHTGGPEDLMARARRKKDRIDAEFDQNKL